VGVGGIWTETETIDSRPITMLVQGRERDGKSLSHRLYVFVGSRLDRTMVIQTMGRDAMRPTSITPIVRPDMRDSARHGTALDHPVKPSLMVPSVDGQSTQGQTRRRRGQLFIPKNGRQYLRNQTRTNNGQTLHPGWSEAVTTIYMYIVRRFRYDTTPPLTSSPFKRSS